MLTTVTANGGKYLFPYIWEGHYFVHIPASQFNTGGMLRGTTSSPGVQAGDDDVGEDSIDVPEPWITGLSTGVIVMTKHSAPTNGGLETGFDKTSDDSTDDQYNLTVDIGVYRPVAIGNLVFNDSNTNGHADPGEGVDGITVELYRSTQVIGTDPPLLTTVTANGGKYLFFDLRAGGYRVHIPQSMFEAGGPLFGKVSVPEGLNGDDDVGENGIDAGDLSVTGISSNAHESLCRPGADRRERGDRDRRHERQPC